MPRPDLSIPDEPECGGLLDIAIDALFDDDGNERECDTREARYEEEVRIQEERHRSSVARWERDRETTKASLDSAFSDAESVAPPALSTA